jgi:hypothetical protein
MFGLRGKKRFGVAVGVIASLALAAGAFAYFTSSGSGTGTATVGSAGAWTVNVSAATGGPLYPGSGSQSIGYTVTNSGSGQQSLAGTTSVVKSSGGDVTQSGTAVPNCLSTWFTATNTAPTPLPQNLAGGATSTSGSVAVTMQDSGTNQDPCQGISPDITISAN